MNTEFVIYTSPADFYWMQISWTTILGSPYILSAYTWAVTHWFLSESSFVVKLLKFPQCGKKSVTFFSYELDDNLSKLFNSITLAKIIILQWFWIWLRLVTRLYFTAEFSNINLQSNNLLVCIIYIFILRMQRNENSFHHNKNSMLYMQIRAVVCCFKQRTRINYSASQINNICS